MKERERVKERVREGNRYIIISSNFCTFQVSRMKKLQDYRVLSFTNGLPHSSVPVFNSWVGNYWARCVFTRCCCLQLSCLLSD